jgi:hypothetical protein
MMLETKRVVTFAGVVTEKGDFWDNGNTVFCLLACVCACLFCILALIA